MLVPVAFMTLALLSETVQAMSQHDMLDASMFWVGLLMVLTPLALIGGVLCYLWWCRRRSRRERVQDA